MTPRPRHVPLAAETPAGVFTLRPLDAVADVDMLHGWMNDPAVARFWELDGPIRRLVAHLEEQFAGTHSRPYLGLVDGEPMSYWELYRAQDDRLAAYYEARPGDSGLHLLLGPARFRGIGLGRHLIETVSRWQLDAPDTSRVVAEPDVRNTASMRAFEQAGFRRTHEIDLPEKRAALMVRDPATTQPPVPPEPAGPGDAA
ncbi:MAG: GNAT family N-acetyltransferase [Nocardioidaceae bacterium]